jgi:catechol 2,3-dioxygenase-like lactoylglutathione lyase family enzyme
VADGSPFERLDFIYMPSSDIARDLVFYRDVLGGELVFAIEAMGTRVAQVKLGETGPRLLLADHLGGEAPILVFRVGDLDAAVAQLRDRGAEVESRFGIPHGPCATLRTTGRERLAIYELSRPEADGHLAGRFDFGPGLDAPEE